MAQVFYRAGFIEAWGRGYEKIMKAFEKQILNVRNSQLRKEVSRP